MREKQKTDLRSGIALGWVRSKLKTCSPAPHKTGSLQDGCDPVKWQRPSPKLRWRTAPKTGAM
jgi:hypothetical protein